MNAHGYQVTQIDAAHWSTEHDLHRDIAAALSFPDYYGHNLDALNDRMRDVGSQDYGWAPNTTGLALVFTGYDAFAAHCPRAAQIVLDIMADHSRTAHSSAAVSCAWYTATIHTSDLSPSAQRPSPGMTPSGSTPSADRSNPPAADL